MYPAPNDTDWQVGRFQHREMVAIGLRQQFAASVLTAAPAPGAACDGGRVTLRRYCEAALLYLRHRLRGGQAASGQSATT